MKNGYFYIRLGLLVFLMNGVVLAVTHSNDRYSNIELCEDFVYDESCNRDWMSKYKNKNLVLLSLHEIEKEIICGMNLWNFPQVKFFWDLLKRHGDVEKKGGISFFVNKFFLNAAGAGCVNSLKFFLAMPEVDMNMKTRGGLNAFDLALYSSLKYWRHLRRLFPSVASCGSQDIVCGACLDCAYILAKRGIVISPCLINYPSALLRCSGYSLKEEVPQLVEQGIGLNTEPCCIYVNADTKELQEYKNLTLYILSVIAREKEKPPSCLDVLKGLFLF